jgi:hypothetical protein
VLTRLILGMVVGGLGINLGLLVFHVIFVHTSPRGFLITGGCMLIALAFAISGLTRSYPFKILFSTVSVAAAIVGTWWVHINFAQSNLTLTPIFVYQYDWSLRQVSLIALGISLPLGILGNMFNLAVEEE